MIDASRAINISPSLYAAYGDASASALAALVSHIP